MNATIRVLLADDDIIVREGLAGLLDRQNGIDVVAVAENGSEALRECSRQVVDVALLDVDMPVLDGLAAAKEMARLYPSVAVVMTAAACSAAASACASAFAPPMCPERIGMTKRARSSITSTAGSVFLLRTKGAISRTAMPHAPMKMSAPQRENSAP